jgi:outer membrane protein assembly factor BamB
MFVRFTGGWLALLLLIAPAVAGPRGLIVQLGGQCPEPDEGQVVHYLIPAASEAAAALESFGQDERVRVDRFDGGRLPHAENTVRHLVCELPDALDESEVLRVLRPLGTARLKTAAGWRELTKPWPEEIDEWTHWLHGPGGNPVAADQRVGVPRRLLWTATPRRARDHEKSPSLTGMVSARGRLFYINDEGPISTGGPLPDKWRLVARDAFSGALLWKLPVPDWGWQAWSPREPMNMRWGNPRFIHRRLVAVGDRVYVTLGYAAPVSVLDAETGQLIRTLNGTEDTSEIICHDGLLVLSVATRPKDSTKEPPPLAVVVVDPESGAIRWRSQPLDSLSDLSERGRSNVLKQGRLMIAADGDRVVAATPETLIAYDFQSGAPVWRTPRPALPAAVTKAARKDDQGQGQDEPRRSSLSLLAGPGSFHLGMLIVDRGRVYFGQPHRLSKMADQIPMTLQCLDAGSGRELWREEVGDWTYTTSFNAYAVGETLVVHGAQRKPTLLVLDAATGNTLKEHDISAVSSSHHHRCYRNKATENFVLLGKEGVEYLDIDSGQVTVNRWIRGTCLFGIMPANGLLYTTPAACACNQMNRLDGFNAIAPAAPPAEPEHPLVHGPAYGFVGEPVPADAWPQYRRDAQRSGCTEVTPTTENGWQVQVGGRLTAPVSDGRRLYFGRNDQVWALDCRDGSEVWRAAGRIDSPPTLYCGLVCYGTRDGWVCCRRAADGELVWRFRAAPEERLILDDNQLESAWPLHGSLLLFQDTLYAVAGRSSFLDGGLRMFALDPATGAVRASRTLFTEQTQQMDYYEGVSNDLLVTDGVSIFLKHMRLDPRTLDVHRQTWWQFSGPDGKLKDYPKPAIALPAEDERRSVLSIASGFLDDELFDRTHAQLDGAEFCNRICFDADRAYGVRHSQGPGHYQFHLTGSGFPVLCFDRHNAAADAADQGPVKWNARSSGSRPADHRLAWQQKYDVRPSALIVAGSHLLLGGGPDRIEPDDPLVALEWRAGGVLRILDRSDGSTMAEQALDAPPVHEGIIAVPSGTFVCLKNGSVIRL